MWAASRRRSDYASLYRGMNWGDEADVQDFVVGKTSRLDAPTATSGDPEWALFFAPPEARHRVLMEIHDA